NVIHIDDMDRFLKEDDVETSKKRDHKYKIMHTILNGKTVYDSDVNGLPLEMRAGESKPRIPEFVLKNT
ncbi:hypothetical protein BDF20DRAFT_789142, partial [Mycotypha africana]|uniref:uncharacterized protein n=1 Tax=Mycotypha africana TaxID=64632 RepID=UPI00230105A6